MNFDLEADHTSEAAAQRISRLLLLNPPIPSILDSCLDAIDIKRRESIEHLAMQFSILSPENAASVSQIAVLAFRRPKERLRSSATCRI
ncbi:hypothetical protein ABIA00_003358 [Bradyrhizobium ottawaense]|uniref:hypothetical protein n=1 Tax=Bradyrhizobium ottawaense TaxID=931866 RepID=UPI0038331C0E